VFLATFFLANNSQEPHLINSNAMIVLVWSRDPGQSKLVEQIDSFQVGPFRYSMLGYITRPVREQFLYNSDLRFSVKLWRSTAWRNKGIFAFVWVNKGG